jgi:MerR family mercuric resistance operon transcriptional regulator
MAEIGAASAKTGVHIETIRYYERIGLVPRAVRSANGRRRYDDRAIARLMFIRRARDLGFPLNDIRALLSLSDKSVACEEAHALTMRHRNSVRAKIRELRRLDRVLTLSAANCQKSGTTPCPIIDALASPLD